MGPKEQIEYIAIDNAMRLVGGVPENLDLMAIVPAEATRRTKPEKATLIFDNGRDVVVRQSIFHI